MRKLLTLTAAAIILASCGNSGDAAVKEKATAAVDAVKTAEAGSDSKYKAGAKFDGAKLGAILNERPDDVKARYGARHPAETLEFFGITPGMTVGEALPGGGWYTKILVPYLGESGTLVGIDYPLSLIHI